MLLYFLVYITVFVVIVIGMVWYSRFMFHKIYGAVRGEIDTIMAGLAPPEWDKRLVQAVSRCRSEEEKDAALAKHKKFINRRVMDCILFMKRTSMVESEAERSAILERLETFRKNVR